MAIYIDSLGGGCLSLGKLTFTNFSITSSVGIHVGDGSDKTIENLAVLDEVLERNGHVERVGRKWLKGKEDQIVLSCIDLSCLSRRLAPYTFFFTCRSPLQTEYTLIVPIHRYQCLIAVLDKDGY